MIWFSSWGFFHPDTGDPLFKNPSSALLSVYRRNGRSDKHCMIKYLIIWKFLIGSILVYSSSTCNSQRMPFPLRLSQTVVTWPGWMHLRRFASKCRATCARTAVGRAAIEYRQIASRFSRSALFSSVSNSTPAILRDCTTSTLDSSYFLNFGKTFWTAVWLSIFNTALFWPVTQCNVRPSSNNLFLASFYVGNPYVFRFG